MAEEDTKYWIYAGGLPYELTEGDVICVFSQYGEISQFTLARDKETGKSRGFGFLKYEDFRSCELAVDNLNGATVVGRRIKVSFANNTNVIKSIKPAVVAPSEDSTLPIVESVRRRSRDRDFDDVEARSPKIKRRHDRETSRNRDNNGDRLDETYHRRSQHGFDNDVSHRTNWKTSPNRRIERSIDHKRDISPGRIRKRSPERGRYKSPETRGDRVQDRRRERSPERRRERSSERRRERSSERRREKSSERRRERSVDRRKERSPERRRERSPVNRHEGNSSKRKERSPEWRQETHRSHHDRKRDHDHRRNHEDKSHHEGRHKEERHHRDERQSRHKRSHENRD